MKSASSGSTDREVGKLWLDRSSMDFRKWAEWGPGWLAKAKTSLADRTAALGKLEAMVVPAELEPVKRYIVGKVRFYLEREALAAKLLAEDNPQTQLVGGIDPAKACPTQVDKVVKAKDRAARLDAIAFQLGNCLNDAHGADYPAAAWKKFLHRYRIRERQHTELNGP
jgi:hypothetical protein